MCFFHLPVRLESPLQLGITDIAVRKTHFRLAGCFLIEDHVLRRRLVEDNQPYPRWICERPARGGAACPQAAAERFHTRFPEISFANRYLCMRQAGARRTISVRQVVPISRTAFECKFR
jgi:hypothetical protein